MATDSQYKAEVSSLELVPQDIQDYFSAFYAVSDSPNGHEKYADMFTQHARLIMISNEANGRDEIFKMRQGMWEKVAKRSHKPKKIFAFGSGPGAEEYMLYGTVDYELKDGRKANVDWAARAYFSREGKEVRMDFYQVYLDSAAMAKAK
ncbi:hypothetical protein LTR62_005373 [Meristemomyces frigidus]|uniref:SnoaL-like domain-containing protein n=1 Tax=Meristemomyces frigidus TaxID=1508187 RepID=A0AAN7YNJ4_9PEZI|nr:hypothetical protein LTR62_005373 [Meristemomyces frigidus]